MTVVTSPCSSLCVYLVPRQEPTVCPGCKAPTPGQLSAHPRHAGPLSCPVLGLEPAPRPRPAPLSPVNLFFRLSYLAFVALGSFPLQACYFRDRSVGLLILLPSSLQPWRELVHPAAVPASGPHGRLEPGELSSPQGSHMPQTRSDGFFCALSLQPQAREQGGALHLAPWVPWVSDPGSHMATGPQDRTCFAVSRKRLTLTRAAASGA